MDKYIKREAAINLIAELIKARQEWVSDARAEIQGLNAAMCGIEDLAVADVQPVRHGRWTDKRTIEHDGEWYCSECGNEVTICMCGKDKTWEYPYCPNCGAKMDGGDTSERQTMAFQSQND